MFPGCKLGQDAASSFWLFLIFLRFHSERERLPLGGVARLAKRRGTRSGREQRVGQGSHQDNTERSDLLLLLGRGGSETDKLPAGLDAYLSLLSVLSRPSGSVLFSSLFLEPSLAASCAWLCPAVPTLFFISLIDELTQCPLPTRPKSRQGPTARDSNCLDSLLKNNGRCPGNTTTTPPFISRIIDDSFFFVWFWIVLLPSLATPPVQQCQKQCQH